MVVVMCSPKIVLFLEGGQPRGSSVCHCGGRSEGRCGTMPKALDVGEVSIDSGSMSHTFDPLTD